MLRRFKLDPAVDDLSHLLDEATACAQADVTRYLLELGANPNRKANGGSAALDRCFDYLEIEHSMSRWASTAIGNHTAGGALATMAALVEHGALWRPDDRRTKSCVRRTLLKCEPRLVISLFKLLKEHGVCADETAREFLDSEPMRKHLSGLEWHLRRLGIAQPKREESVSCYLLAKFDREQLYEEVWSGPMLKLAPKYGISDVALAKAFQKLKIPLAGRGYWSKVAAGQEPGRRPALPALRAGKRN